MLMEEDSQAKTGEVALSLLQTGKSTNFNSLIERPSELLSKISNTRRGFFVFLQRSQDGEEKTEGPLAKLPEGKTPLDIAEAFFEALNEVLQDDGFEQNFKMSFALNYLANIENDDFKNLLRDDLIELINTSDRPTCPAAAHSTEGGESSNEENKDENGEGTNEEKKEENGEGKEETPEEGAAEGFLI
jgi:hypothetical protein